MAQIEIDGKKIEATQGAMLIEVADENGIAIPRFCYHKKLSIAANCRMCLVDVEKAPKPLPACATPVTDGMKVWTQSKKTLDAQKSVMEFLLINHPLDCPICDQGGECELQDLAMGYGKDISRFVEGKRVVKDKNIGPLVATDMTRCIQCTRCVRFGAEIAGLRELGATGRGEHMEIGTFIEQNVESEVSGNIIDICPVGALTSKPFRFKARGWELKQSSSIAPHDCVGSNIFIHSRRSEVLRVVPKANESINEVWISDRDRFSYEGCNNSHRLKEPKLKQKGHWQKASWNEALMEAAERIQYCVKEFGPEEVGALISPTATVEECYLIQKLLRSFDCHNIDHRLRQIDFRGSEEKNSPFPNLGVPIADLENQAAIVLIGSNIHKEQPSLGLKLRKNTLSNGQVMVINTWDCAYHFGVAFKSIVENGNLTEGVAQLAKAVFDAAPKSSAISSDIQNQLKSFKSLKEIEHNSAYQKMAKALWEVSEREKISFLIGALALHHPDYANILAYTTLIAEMLKPAKIGILSDGPNSAGATLAGALPNRLPGRLAANSGVKVQGLNLQEMIQKPLKCYLLFGIDPALDCSEGQALLTALDDADTVISFSIFDSAMQHKHADILLPISPFTETSGTYVNVEGRWQSFRPAVDPLEESRPGWKVLRLLGTLCKVPNFEYDASEEILAEVRQHCVEIDTTSLECPQLQMPLERSEFSLKLEQQGAHSTLVRIAPVPLYSVDSLVRHSTPLQKTQEGNPPSVMVNPTTAQILGISNVAYVKVYKAGTTNALDPDHSSVLSLVLSDKIPEHTVLIESGRKETVALGAPYGFVHLVSE